MPFYHYKCKLCNETVEKFHGMNEKLTDCDLCFNQDCLYKLINTNISVGHVSKVGNIVKDFIEASKEELREAKESLDKRNK